MSTFYSRIIYLLNKTVFWKLSIQSKWTKQLWLNTNVREQTFMVNIAEQPATWVIKKPIWEFGRVHKCQTKANDIFFFKNGHNQASYCLFSLFSLDKYDY